jgi:hypothetical protein
VDLACRTANRRSPFVKVAAAAHRHLSKDLTSEPQAGPIADRNHRLLMVRRSRDQLQ